jgi:glycosyltransferase involved in cell wall biosynthesis
VVVKFLSTLPLVSVLCVTRNRPAFLRNALRLFRAQTWPRKELIVVDDSDPGKRLDLSRESDVRYERLTDRRTLGAKLNRACDLAQGEILAYQDDDDYYGPARLTAQVLPIAGGAATVTGIPRIWILRLPARSWHQLKAPEKRPHVSTWIGNGAWGLKMGDFGKVKDNTLCWDRGVHERGARHVDAAEADDKVTFAERLNIQGERLVVVQNAGHFVYVRHGYNLWRYREDLIEMPALRPAWLPQTEIAALAAAAAADSPAAGKLRGS